MCVYVCVFLAVMSGVKDLSTMYWMDLDSKTSSRDESNNSSFGFLLGRFFHIGISFLLTVV